MMHYPYFEDFNIWWYGLRMVIPLIIIVIFIFYIIKVTKNGEEHKNHRNKSLEILNERLASGDISEEEYKRKRELIE